MALFVLYDICFLFLQLIEIISIAKLLIIVHFFVLKHEKQTLHTKFQGDKNNHFFSLQFILLGHPFFAKTLKITWAWEVDAPVITWYE